MEVRELLIATNFPGDDTPIIIGSALEGAEGDRRASWAVAPREGSWLRRSTYIPEPERATWICRS